jgi:hypothetical protein
MIENRIFGSTIERLRTRLRAKHIALPCGEQEEAGPNRKGQRRAELTQIEKEQLDFFEKKGAMLLTCAAVAECLETILGRAIPNRFRLTFGEKLSPQRAERPWLDVLEPLFPLIS